MDALALLLSRLQFALRSAYLEVGLGHTRGASTLENEPNHPPQTCHVVLRWESCP
jgi:hypothetical protein